jgi:hypothetical protein
MLKMKVTQHPWRQFAVTIDYVEDLTPAVRGAGVEPHVKALFLPGVLEELTLEPYPDYHGGRPVYGIYADGTRYVIIEITIFRKFTHIAVVGKKVVLGNETYIYYDNGTRLDLGVSPDPIEVESKLFFQNPHPPGKEGLARTLYLHLDYGLESVIGRYNGISIFKGKSGQQIRVPGDGKIVPTI